MKFVKATAIVVVVAIVGTLIVASAYAQQPTGVPTQAPRNPNWCSDVPATTPPLNKISPEEWASTRDTCINGKHSFLRDKMCFDMCQGARELWERANDMKQHNTTAPEVAPPTSTDKLQGPFPLKGGGNGWVLPLPNTPVSGTTPMSSNSGLAGPTGPFLKWSGADLSATNDATPPDVAAEVNFAQNVEFVNGSLSIGANGGLYVYNKAGALQKPHTDTITFWCGSPGVNGSLLTGCIDNSHEELLLTDTQVGFVPSLGLWVVTELAHGGSPSQVYVAASDTIDATGTWEKWSVPVCNTDSGVTFPDQPLLGWSTTIGGTQGVVAIDVKCATSDAGGIAGPDNLILIPNATIASHALSLPGAIDAPCSSMTPARDEQGSFSSVYLLASEVPNTSGGADPLATCAPNLGNKQPYVIEYTANSTGVSGSGGACMPATSCLPVSVSPQFGMPGLYRILPFAQQHIVPPYDTGACATSSMACEIDLGNARITGAQIRVSKLLGTNQPILTTGFSTAICTPNGTGGCTSGGPLTQNVWFAQSLGSGNPWLTMLNITSAVGGWVAYPTIAIDNDQDFFVAWTLFGATFAPETNWESYTGFLFPRLLGAGLLESSNSTYIGQAGSGEDLDQGPQRWGDYNTMVYDANAQFSGEHSFWQIEEISKGGTDQSTTWTELGDPTPLPFFVPGGSDNHESECTNNTCGVKATIPSGAGVQNGDLILVALVAGEATTKKPGLPDTTWTLLPASNITGTPDHVSVTDKHGTNTTWLAAHIYGTSAESGSYVFTQSLSNGPEQGEFMVIYRGASPNLSSYTAYGFKRGGNNSSFNMDAVSPPGESQLVSIAYADVGCEASESTEPNGVSFASPSGAPGLTPETALTPPQLAWLASDTSVLVADQIYGPYTNTVSVTGSCINTTGGFLGWEVGVPEL